MSPDWFKKGRLIYCLFGDLPDSGWDRERWKFGVLLGYSRGPDRMSFVIINSADEDEQPKVRPEDRALQIEVSKDEIKGLKHKSFIDCSQLTSKHAYDLWQEFQKFSNTQDYGQIKPEILDQILEKFKDSDDISRTERGALDSSIEPRDFDAEFEQL